MIAAPSLRKTSSKARLNLLSRSWIRNCGSLVRRPPRSQMRLRACWAAQVPLGLLVTATCSMRRRSSEMKKST
jgi:hypothetical protein